MGKVALFYFVRNIQIYIKKLQTQQANNIRAGGKLCRIG